MIILKAIQGCQLANAPCMALSFFAVLFIFNLHASLFFSLSCLCPDYPFNMSFTCLLETST